MDIAQFIAKCGIRAGKISKSGVIQFIIETELGAGRKLDRKRVMLLAQKKLEQFPEHLQADAKLTPDDYRHALELFKKDSPSVEDNGRAPAREVLPHGPETFTRDELLRASRFLRSCGSSLVRAKQLLDFLFALTKEQGS